MRYRHTRAQLAAVVLTLGLGLRAQAPLEFDVASVKPSGPGQRFGGIRPMPGNQRYAGTNVSLRLAMTVAYSVTDRQISGGPPWTGTDLFDFDAKAARPGSIEDLHMMLQHLLEERFQLRVRRETRELPVWELVVDKGGAHMPVHDPEDKNYPPVGAARGGMKGTNVKMDYFAFVLSRVLERNVIDKTGLPARYDVNLEFAQDRPGAVRVDGADPSVNQQDGPTIFTALREQLGLKLVPSKGPVVFLVIEHAEKPSEN